MKQIAKTAGGGGWRIPTEDDVKVAEILLDLPKLRLKSELIGGYSFNWGRKKKRSMLDLKSESSPSTETQPPDKSPSTPLGFFTGGSGSDGSSNRKPPSSVKKTLKRKETDDLMEAFNKMQQEREFLTKKVKAIDEELTSQNIQPKARRKKINNSRNPKDIHKSKSSKKSIDKQHCHQQTTIFAPATPQQVEQQQCQQQLVVDTNKSKPVCCRINQIDPRVKVNGLTGDFMASFQPLDQRRYDIIIKAAAARKNRLWRIKAKMNKDCVIYNDFRVWSATAVARKNRMLKMKEQRAMRQSKVCR